MSLFTGKRKRLILSSGLCSCRVIDVPPVGQSELEQIIPYRLSSFYPGSVEDLYYDYVREGDRAVIFFSPKNKIDLLRKEQGNADLYSTWHLLASLQTKDGAYAVPASDRIDIYEYKDNSLLDFRSCENSPSLREELEREGTIFAEGDGTIPRRCAPIFGGKKRRNYLLPNLLLLALVIALPQLAWLRQVRMEEAYVSTLRSEIIRLAEDSVRISSTEEELKNLWSEYEKIQAEKPLKVTEFLSDLSAALGRDVHIESLLLKGRSFQLNGTGVNPLGKMEQFQENGRFSHVLPYQVKAIEGSGRESFSLTGMYEYE